MGDAIANTKLRRYLVDHAGGMVSSSASLVVGHPFDTVKVRLQAGHTPYRGAIDCMMSTIRSEGFRALFKGMLWPLLTNSGMGAIQFSTWQEAQRRMHPGEDGTPAPLPTVFLAGGIAGIAQCSLATPVELIRSKLQVQHEGRRLYNGNWDCLKKIFKTEGIAGLYRGNVSMILRETPAFGVFFSVYEGTKRAFCPELKPDEKEPMWLEALGGASTGAITWTCVMPADVISTRIQCLPEDQALDPAKRSFLRVGKTIWQEGGIRAFYCGLGPAVLRGIVLNAMLFPVYEMTVHHLSHS